MEKIRIRTLTALLCACALSGCGRSVDVLIIGGGTGRSIDWTDETWVKLPDNE